MRSIITTVAAAAALAAAALASLPAQAAVDVGVSIGIAEPGVYGRVDIGRFPQPVLVAPQPVIIGAPVVAAPPPPVYLWVPPAQRHNWRRYCGRYNACGAPVYFVQDRWYRQHVMPYRGHPGGHPPGPPPGPGYHGGPGPNPHGPHGGPGYRGHD